MNLQGAGPEQTIITATTNFIPNSTLGDVVNGFRLNIGDNGLTNFSTGQPNFDESAYLVGLTDNTSDLTISGIHFIATNRPVRVIEEVQNDAGEIVSEDELFNQLYPILHGAIWGARCSNLILENYKFSNFAWSAVRTWGAENPAHCQDNRRHRTLDANTRKP